MRMNDIVCDKRGETEAQQVLTEVVELTDSCTLSLASAVTVAPSAVAASACRLDPKVQIRFPPTEKYQS